MNESPYFTGAAPNFGPPSGMAGLIAQDRASGAGGAAGFQQFADAIDKFKQQQSAGKAADYFVKANPAILSDMGIHAEQWKTLGAREKTAAVSGIVKGQAQAEVMQQFADMARKNKARADFQSFARENPNAEPRQILGAAMKSGLPFEDMARIGQSLNAIEGSGAGQGPQYDEDAVTGYRYYRFGKQVMPSGVNPAKVGTPKTVIIKDASGNDVAGTIDPRTGRFTPLGDPSGPSGADQYKELFGLKKTYLAAQAKAYLPAEKQSLQEEIDAIDAQIKTLSDRNKTTAPTPAAAPPAVGGATNRFKIIQVK